MTALANARPIAAPAPGGRSAVDEARNVALSLRGLTVAYGDRPAIFSVDADFEAGQRTAIVGPNGAGKSTLLKAALGVVPALAGTCRIFGQPLAAARKRIAYVPQRASVDWDFPARVRDVVTMGLFPELGLLARLRAEHHARIEAALDAVGMSEFAGRQIGQLSGGQAQRVFIARALATRADIFILDEPLAGVDAATEAAILKVLAGLKQEGRTVIAVHHDLSTVRRTFDRVLLINQRVIAEGTVAEALTDSALRQAYGGRLSPADTPSPVGPGLHEGRPS